MKIDDLDKVPDRPTPSPGGDVRPVRSVEAASPVHQRKSEDGIPDKPEGESAGQHGGGDRVSLHGIPQAEVTPAVAAALRELMQEIGDLREALKEAQSQNAYLSTLADQDMLSPVLNRRAFRREIAHAVSLDQEFGSRSTLALFALDNLDELNEGYGIAAGDTALGHMGTVLADAVDTHDVVGRLGGGTFGVVLVATLGQEARRRTAWIHGRLEGSPLSIQGRPMTLHISTGLHALEEREDVSDAIEAVERDLHRKL